MNAIFALAIKDLRLLMRDKVGFFFTFVFPIGYASLFGVIMSGMSGGSESTGGIPVVVVDEDQTTGSKAFIEEMTAWKEFKVQTGTLEAAKTQVRKGERSAYIVFPKGFAETREQIFWGDPPRIEVGVDPSRQAEAAMIEGILTGKLFEGVQDAFTNPDKMTKQIDESLANLAKSDDANPVTRATLATFLPALKMFIKTMAQSDNGGGMADAFKPADINVVSVAREKGEGFNAYAITFPQGIIWGVMGCVASFGISLVVERTKGTLLRLRMAPLSRVHVLAGKGLACLFTTVTVATCLIVFGIVVFDIQPNSYVKLAIGIFSVSLGFVGIMMLLSVAGKTEQSAGGIGWAVMMVMAMLGGGMMPLAFLPKFMQDVGTISPVKWSILAIEGATWRNFSYAEMALPCAILMTVGIVCFAIGARAFKWST